MQNNILKLVSLDDIDLRILNYLQQDGRMTNAALAAALGMAPSAMLERVRKLEKNRVIRGFGPRIDPESLGLKLLAFIQVRTGEGPGSLRIGKKLAALSGVLELHHIAGEDCFLMKVRARDPQSLAGFLRQQLGKIPGILSTRTTIVLETLSENNLIPIPGISNGK